jgi:hypothetical protein
LYEYFEPPIGGNVVLHAEAAVGFARCGWFAGGYALRVSRSGAILCADLVERRSAEPLEPIHGAAGLARGLIERTALCVTIAVGESKA